MTQLIINKISLPAGLPRISRTRLIEKLGGCLATCNLTVINGRAGTGKTLLATDFAWQCGRRVAWYKVDAADSDPAIFFRYLIASINRQRLGAGGIIVEELLEKNMAGLAESLAYELEQASIPLLIVLDDLHLVYDAEWIASFFSRFSPLLPPETHLIIIGRIQPPAPLWRMRSKQTLCIIDEADLDFTMDEIVMMLESYGLEQSAASEVFTESRGRASRVSAIVRQMLVDGRSISKFEAAPRKFLQ